MFYHPISDANHCIYRFLLILSSIKSKSIEIQKIKTFDLFLLFPDFLKQIKLPNKLRDKRKVIDSVGSSYEALPDPRKLLFEMGEIHKAANNYLFAKGIIKLDESNPEKIVLQMKIIPPKLSEQLSNDPIRNEPWFLVIVNDLLEMTFEGVDGFKKRSGLMEYRYDT